LISRQPILLDELLSPQTLYSPPDRPALEATLEMLLSRISADDLEQQMDELRRFRQAAMLRVAAADVSEGLTVQEVSDRLTDIAEVIIEKVLGIVWRQMASRYGVPGEVRRGIHGFAVIAYGKLGGREMGYGSDLDLVFLHSGRVGHMTHGPNPIDNTIFYSRVGQRMIHILTIHTQVGILYEVDMRLRPSGSSGVLVSSLDAFSEYQKNLAWTWEHQALVRARAIAGDPWLCKKFEDLRKDIIKMPRDPMALKTSVREMRDRLIDKATDRFDIKHGPSGLIDIEFLIQYTVLANAHQHPDLAEWRNDTRLIEAFRQKALISKRYTDTLIEASVDYRKEINQLSLQERPPLLEADALLEQRAAVQKIWNEIMG
ncbi:MAG: bifunctional glutamine synthetase adenylyltransferase/deadenyltransferase, partial [Nitrospiraceae bacterium]|nr:bifunctional glutamine synthetase adenylyltransferase/deadenyltransferase [Nitrospiraceae bacterium]